SDEVSARRGSHWPIDHNQQIHVAVGTQATCHRRAVKIDSHERRPEVPLNDAQRLLGFEGNWD
ncbi:MAG TPA: hypothetical protein VKY39_07200, partial [Aggregatilineales bacterium]|nr:hypothetical protein [Aggregatilineales bacterium]